MSVGRFLFTSKFQRFAILVGILLQLALSTRSDPFVRKEVTG
jgi:hypothetical protein